MKRSRMFVLFSTVLCASMTAAAQGTYPHFSEDVNWQTTFTLVNMSLTDQAQAQISFFADDGTPLAMQIAGRDKAAVQQVAIPAGGSVTLALDAAGASWQGWAKLDSTNDVPIKGQGIFRRHQAGVPEAEGIVPLDTGYQPPSCIMALPNLGPPASTILPFDNTAGAYVTAIAIVNISHASRAIDLEYADETNHVLATDQIVLGAQQHTAFMVTDRIPTLANTKGVLHVNAGPQDVSLLAFLMRPTGTFTTILPVTQ
jgi:hypothetical protein